MGCPFSLLVSCLQETYINVKSALTLKRNCKTKSRKIATQLQKKSTLELLHVIDDN